MRTSCPHENASRYALFAHQDTGNCTVSGNGGDKLVIPIDGNGHYRTNGSINGAPVRFLVDTGAYGISMSRDLANRSGIYHCRFTGVSTTANGPVEICTADNVPVEFGPHRLSNVSVAILPQMGAEVLLGMSVLRNFRMEQLDGVLTISR